MDNAIKVIRSSMPPFEEYIDEIRPLWESAWLSNSGALHKKLEQELTQYLRVENLNLFANGDRALNIAIDAFDLAGEVITTPFTFASTTHNIVQNGLTPVFCDIDPSDFNIDANKIEALITEKTSAIIPVHIFGNACDVEKIDEIAKKYDLKVIYDAAQAFGVTVNGKGIGSYGDAAVFSFHSTKSFHTIEGGAVTFSDLGMREKLSKLGNFGMEISTDGGEDIIIGHNAKMNEFEAAMGLCNLRHIAEELAKRKAADEKYRSRLKNVTGIKYVPFKDHISNNYTYFPVLVDEEEYGCSREELMERFFAENIYPRKYFYVLTTDYKCYKTKYGDADLPVARLVAERVLALPMYADLTLEDVDRICDVIEK